MTGSGTSYVLVCSCAVIADIFPVHVESVRGKIFQGQINPTVEIQCGFRRMWGEFARAMGDVCHRNTCQSSPSIHALRDSELVLGTRSMSFTSSQ